MPERLERVPPAWAKVHRVSAGALLLAERRALAGLRRAVSDAAGELALRVSVAPRLVGAAARAQVMGKVQTATTRARLDVGHAVVEHRSAARELALQRLDRELTLVGRDVDTDIDRPTRSDGAEDQVHGDAAGGAYAAAFAATLMPSVLKWADDPSNAIDVAGAVKAQDYRLRRIAATEVARAYNDEHDEGVGWVATRYDGARWLAALFKRWDAILDRRTCAVCKAHDGELALAGTTFEGGDEPSEMHPICRCLDSLIFLPAKLAGQPVPGEATSDIDVNDEEAA